MKQLNLIRSIAVMLIVSTTLTVATSCGKDKVATPVVTLTEVGHENSHIAIVGDDMHLEANILAEGLIKSIYVEMHLEEGDYEIEVSYLEGKYIGVKNTEFHEHIDIPADAPTGEYHLHLTVTDQHGQQTQATTQVDVKNEEA